MTASKLRLNRRARVRIVKFDYRVTNSGRTDLNYRVTFVVRGPSNAIVYDSSESGEDEFVRVANGETSDLRSFVWRIPFGSLKGDYRVGIQIRNAYEFDQRPFDAIETTDADAITFSVLEGARISVTPAEWQFGSILQQEGRQDTATFQVTNIGKPPF